jgi:predicted ArsR family transcriptional regulator
MSAVSSQSVYDNLRCVDGTVAIDRDAALDAAAALGDDLRRDLYRFVCSQASPVTREQAARAARISVKLAAFHLDKLVDRGLLDADHAIPEGERRQVGRAPKRYRVSSRELTVSMPPRRYDLMGEILVDTLADLAGRSIDGMPESEFRAQAAFERGQQLGAGARDARRLGRLSSERTLVVLEELLDGCGFLPTAHDGQGLVLLNCPFKILAQRAPAMVCALNLAFIDGILRGLGSETVVAELRPENGRCCVRVQVQPPRAVSGQAPGGR